MVIVSGGTTLLRLVKLCVLSKCGPTGVHMIEELERRVGIDHVIRVAWSSRSAPPTSRPSLLTRARKLTPAKVASRLDGYITHWQMPRFDRRVSKVLFGSPEPPAVRVDSEVFSHEINSEATAERIRALAPDLLLVNGAPILRPNIFTIPRLGTVNVHFGIAPAYRGTNANFWPLYFRDFDNVGVTVHYIDETVDGGKLLALGYPELSPDDSEANIKAKCAVLATELVTSFLEKTRGEAPGKSQESVGRLFRNRDRTVWLQLRLALRHRVPGRQIPRRPERRVEFFEASEP